jgi:hypothetical protein
LGGEGGGEEEEGEEEAHSISDFGFRIADCRGPPASPCGQPLAGCLPAAICASLRFALLGCGLENGEWMTGLG